MNRIAATFNERYLNLDEWICTKTIYNCLRRNNITRHVLERRHIRQDPDAILAYLQIMVNFHVHELVDIDETLTTTSEFEEKYGYAACGNRAEKLQLIIRGHHYSVTAAYCERGFIFWRIYEGSVRTDEFCDFLKNLQPYLTDTSVGLVDNCNIHHVQRSRNLLENIFNGRYIYSPSYTPEMKPIELGFSNIKRYIRQFEDDAIQDPLRVINEAFELYSITGPFVEAAYGNWNIYRDNINQQG
jgi:transposase